MLCLPPARLRGATSANAATGDLTFDLYAGFSEMFKTLDYVVEKVETTV
jgi:hypothetical protein